MPESVNKLEFIKELPENLFTELLGKKEMRVAVLGAFDTWPYMHKICVDIVKCGFVAVTSRYIYRPSEETESRYFRTKRENDGMEMNRFLQEKVIKLCNSAIIVYSVPAAHYNEADWCNSLGIRTLGIAFVRSIHGEGYCDDCILDEASGFSYCSGEGNAWGCISNKACPFKEQGISKSQLEYFLMPDRKMSLISVEKLEKTTAIIDDFLNDRLNLPKKLPHVFEFRLDITKEKFDELSAKFDEVQKKSEDSANSEYEYIDYYYKPKGVQADDWFKKKHSIRIRESKNPIRRRSTVYYAEVESTSQGFYCKEPFGGIIWYEGELSTSKKLLEEMRMECFLKAIKVGRFSHLKDGEGKLHNTRFKGYIESIDVEKPNEKKRKYGYSIEIELWTDQAQGLEEIIERKNEIIKLLKLENCDQQVCPVQEFIYKWSNENCSKVIKVV